MPPVLAPRPPSKIRLKSWRRLRGAYAVVAVADREEAGTVADSSIRPALASSVRERLGAVAGNRRRLAGGRAVVVRRPARRTSGGLDLAAGGAGA